MYTDHNVGQQVFCPNLLAFTFTYGEDQLVVMFGGLHIEMTALKTLGDWLQGSRWTQALVQAEITTAETADSFLRAAHVTRTRRAHQITAAVLYNLQRCAYDKYSTTNTEDDEHPGSFEDWCSQREQSYPQFQYCVKAISSYARLHCFSSVSFMT